MRRDIEQIEGALAFSKAAIQAAFTYQANGEGDSMEFWPLLEEAVEKLSKAEKGIRGFHQGGKSPIGENL